MIQEKIKHQWDKNASSQELKKVENKVSKDFVYNQYAIAITEHNILQQNKIKLSLSGKTIMLGVCDKKIRKERGMTFSDKSYIGHGMYLIYNSVNGPYIFSHWDEKANYNEGGFKFYSNDIQMEVENNKLIYKSKGQQQYVLEIKGNKMEDLYFCAVIGEGSVEIIV